MPNHFAIPSVNWVSISSPIGTQISQAAGAARAMQIRGDADRVVWVWFGDGGTSSNDFHAGMNFAGVWKAPCVFMCENNHWAISVPQTQQTASASFADKAIAYGCRGVRVDGNDVLAVYEAAKEARERAAKGEGPTLIETVTFRMGPHSTSDDPSRYQSIGTVRELEEEGPGGPIPQVAQGQEAVDARLGRRDRRDVQEGRGRRSRTGREHPHAGCRHTF